MIKVTGKEVLSAWCGLFKVRTKDGRELIGSFVPAYWSREMSDDLSKVEREDYFVKFQALTDDLDVLTSTQGRMETYAPQTISFMDIVECKRLDLTTDGK